MAEQPSVKPADNKPAQGAMQPPVKQEDPKKESGPKKHVDNGDHWMYHKDHEPRLFKKDEKHGEGWEAQNKFGWYKDPKNNFHWRKK